MPPRYFITPRPGSDRSTKNKIYGEGPLFYLLERRNSVPELQGKKGVLLSNLSRNWSRWVRLDWLRLTEFKPSA